MNCWQIKKPEMRFRFHGFHMKTFLEWLSNVEDIWKTHEECQARWKIKQETSDKLDEFCNKVFVGLHKDYNTPKTIICAKKMKIRLNNCRFRPELENLKVLLIDC